MVYLEIIEYPLSGIIIDEKSRIKRCVRTNSFMIHMVIH